jgi:hypothetical protein
MIERIEAMLPSGGWVQLDAWDSEGARYDSDGWLDKWGARIEGGIAPLPGGGTVNLGRFLAVRGSSK